MSSEFAEASHLNSSNAIFVPHSSDMKNELSNVCKTYNEDCSHVNKNVTKILECGRLNSFQNAAEDSVPRRGSTSPSSRISDSCLKGVSFAKCQNLGSDQFMWPSASSSYGENYFVEDYKSSSTQENRGNNFTPKLAEENITSNVQFPAPSLYQLGLPKPEDATTLQGSGKAFTPATSISIRVGDGGSGKIEHSIHAQNDNQRNDDIEQRRLDNTKENSKLQLQLPSFSSASDQVPNRVILRSIVVPDHTTQNPISVLSSAVSVDALSNKQFPNILESSRNPSSSVEQGHLISTEAQTEELPALSVPSSRATREQRKRERRERRRNRNSNIPESLEDRQNSQLRSEIGPGSSLLPDVEAVNPREHDAHSVTGNSRQTVVPPNSNSATVPGSRLPDLLNSHLPPPYSTLPQAPFIGPRRVSVVGGTSPPFSATPTTMIATSATSISQGTAIIPGAPHPPPPCFSNPPQHIRYHLTPVAGNSRRSNQCPYGGIYSSEDAPKSCCGISASQAVSIRWFIIAVATMGICCTVSGTALGAAKQGKEHVTLALIMIGVGVVFLTAAAVAWRLTSSDGSSSCSAMLGLSSPSTSRDCERQPNRRLIQRLAPSYGRPHHPYAAMMYPEFHYRPPPPSYQQSMQEYRLRLLLLERSNPVASNPGGWMTAARMPMPPPPAYRRGVGYGQNMCSRPPSYRSHSSINSGTPNGIDTSNLDLQIMDPIPGVADDLSVVSGHTSPSTHCSKTAPTVVTVVPAMEVAVGIDLSLNYDSKDNKDPGALLEGNQGNLHDLECTKGFDNLEDGSGEDRKAKDGNIVRIVQTTESSQVIAPDSVIVTVSGSNQSLWDETFQEQNQPALHYVTAQNMQTIPSGEVQILAHL